MGKYRINALKMREADEHFIDCLAGAIKSVAVTVSASSSSGASAADAELVGGKILGYFPTSNQDQFVDSVVLGANGAVTVTLAANATADNVFAVMVLKA